MIKATFRWQNGTNATFVSIDYPVPVKLLFSYKSMRVPFSVRFHEIDFIAEHADPYFAHAQNWVDFGVLAPSSLHNRCQGLVYLIDLFKRFLVSTSLPISLTMRALSSLTYHTLPISFFPSSPFFLL